MWGLRAANELAGILATRGELDRARRTLDAACDAFPDEAASPDLKRGRALVAGEIRQVPSVSPFSRKPSLRLCTTIALARAQMDMELPVCAIRCSALVQPRGNSRAVS